MPEQKFEIIAKTLHGFESILATEIEKIGGQNINILKRAVSFTGNTELLYKSNLYLRTALKILKPLGSFKVSDNDTLYKGVKEINWSDYISPTGTICVESVINTKIFNHSGFVALKSKDAIVDQIREKHGRRPSIDTENPDVRIHIHISNNLCHILLDSSGEPLFKRGYRLAQGFAPLNEVLAAGLIMLTGWDGTKQLIDPMCGSGTIPIEAALIANKIPPNIKRQDFGFEHWTDFDRNIWRQIREEANENINRNKPEIPVFASDISTDAIENARKNTLKLPLNQAIKFVNKPFERLDPPAGDKVLIMNPPYGERLKENEINEFYGKIGSTLKQKYIDTEAWILSSNFEALKFIGLKASEKHQVFNGKLECKFQKFEMYEGSKKSKHKNLETD